MRKSGFAAVLLAALALCLVPERGTGQDIGFERDRAFMMLAKISSDIEKNFYDPKLRGLDWKGLAAEAHQRIERARSVDAIYTALFALVEKLQDSHTKFLPPQRAAKIRFGFDAKAIGDKVVIYEVKKKGAAEAAGLQPGDQLIAVNGFKTERATFDLMWLFFKVLNPVTAMDLIVARGAEPPRKLHVEAKVQMGAIIEDLTKLDNIYKLIREAQMEEERARYLLTEEGIGYLWMPDFDVDLDQVNVLVKKIEKARAVVVDLRNNPGGRVDALAHFLGFFEAEPTTLADIVTRSKTEPIRIKPQKPSLSGPLFLLVDSRSASAAEMCARHFQRTRRGVVVGDASSGRVTVSRVFSGRVGTETAVFYGVQIAIGRAVFPGGEELENRGVTPDHLCLPSSEDLREGRDPCRALAFSLARKALGPSEQPTGESKQKKN